MISILDIETTGLDIYFDMICEIGLCSLNLDTGEIEPMFNIICQEENKEFDKNAWIFQNSDLTIYNVRKAPYLEEYRKSLQELLDIYPCTAYNQEFDFGFLESRNFKIHEKFWDAMHKLTPILKIPRYNGYKYPSVQEAYNYLYPKENYVERHRALDDAKHEAKIIYATYKLLKERKKT
ncbi:3'-5' exonuclease DinG [subsurface metagenome]